MDAGEAPTPPERPRRVRISLLGRAGRSLAPAVVAIGALALVAAWQGARWSETEILKTEAMDSATTWVAFVRVDLPDLNGLLATRRVTALDRAVFRDATRAGNIVAYRLRDAGGVLVLADPAAAAPPLRVGRNTAELGARERDVVIERTTDGTGATSVIALVRVPLIDRGRLVGDVEVELDRTARAATLSRIADQALIGLAVVLAALGLAMAGHVRRNLRAERRATRQLRLAKGNAEQAAELARRALGQAQAASSGKSAFFAAVSHEIRTPMSGVLGMANLLIQTPLSDEQRDYVETIRMSGAALLTIINDVLDYSKMESGSFDLDVVEFDLVEMIEGIALLLAPQADEKGLDLWTFVPPDGPRHVTGDQGRLRQILLNLAGNAVKFTSSGAVSLTVAVAAREDGDITLRFEVRDTGIGISQEARAKLFARFAQADSSIGRTYGGTGLGLAISKQLVELMGGEIGVDSTPGKGSTFWATVRLAVSDRGAGAPSPETPRVAGRTALVVDGSALNRRALRLSLEAWGMIVAEAEDGPAALAALDRASAAERPFAVALIDADLDGMTGDELMACIRQRWELAATKLVAIHRLSARGVEPAGTPAIADATIRKPIIQSSLLDCLAGVLDGRGAPAAAADVTVPEPDAEIDAPTAPRRLHLLLAEDNQVNQKVISVMLLKAGHAVDVVANGDDAIAAVRARDYDVVLMDIQMPKMDGVTATRQIRRLPGSESRVPIVALTANAMAGDRESFLSAGMSDYVSKPIDPKELAAAIERQCGVAIRLDGPVAAVDTPRPEAEARDDELVGLLDRLDGVG